MNDSKEFDKKKFYYLVEVLKYEKEVIYGTMAAFHVFDRDLTGYVSK